MRQTNGPPRVSSQSALSRSRRTKTPAGSVAKRGCGHRRVVLPIGSGMVCNEVSQVEAAQSAGWDAAAGTPGAPPVVLPPQPAQTRMPEAIRSVPDQPPGEGILSWPQAFAQVEKPAKGGKAASDSG